MPLKDSANRLAVRLRETVEQFCQQELERAYSHEDFVQQASVTLDLVANECLMFGASVFDDEKDALAPLEKVVSLEDAPGVRGL
ncbi:hypothetical protein JQ615_38325 [Bradyrhizobium jicamae]|uniref:Acyl carrier protein n=1 Tax=Bradyrhizobium jicamae TaxID=280332 RepID=A0ABS5FYA4_9BRAD|nr:hypothetical protein [Bradyrhizobium jicamae]MBR0801226.1 hypothetical protein [Bradyrhizobium jicamae]